MDTVVYVLRQGHHQMCIICTTDVESVGEDNEPLVGALVQKLDDTTRQRIPINNGNEINRELNLDYRKFELDKMGKGV